MENLSLKSISVVHGRTEKKDEKVKLHGEHITHRWI